METAQIIAVAYLAFINLAAFILFGIDKRRAVRGRYRISESRLHLSVLLGGFIGGFLGMMVFRHKTRKLGFLVLFFLAAIVSVVVLGKILSTLSIINI